METRIQRGQITPSSRKAALERGCAVVTSPSFSDTKRIGSSDTTSGFRAIRTRARADVERSKRLGIGLRQGKRFIAAEERLSEAPEDEEVPVLLLEDHVLGPAFRRNRPAGLSAFHTAMSK